MQYENWFWRFGSSLIKSILAVICFRFIFWLLISPEASATKNFDYILGGILIVMFTVDFYFKSQD